MRGEYGTSSHFGWDNGELPPRARRIHRICDRFHVLRGTTSACAENTMRSVISPAPTRNYLRVRGEYDGFTVFGSNITELPPRARRIRFHHKRHAGGGGTTSACAENTCRRRQTLGYPWNYLRVRGEYILTERLSMIFLELPPRARRIHIEKGTGAWGTGTTSACAENTNACDTPH